MCCDNKVQMVIRRAESRDRTCRESLIREGISSYHWDAFILFFFQELTLECCVLSGAVLFIFLGVSAVSCCCVIPAAVAVVAGAVVCAHHIIAEKQIQNMQRETMGYVAEVYGPLLLDPRHCTHEIVSEEDHSRVNPGRPMCGQVVGTVSLHDGRLQALHVGLGWRGRGCGEALVVAAVKGAAAFGWQSLAAACSELQWGARSLLQRLGFVTRGSHHRRLLGSALTLLISHLSLDLASSHRS